ncbi:Arm DNA-binding domain-containing protein [Janthinobacterium sp. RB2P8]|uniref:Arm DNA-binding domain-containing protein n=1 Tax=Janthinobacterium sp. RB2P8 TaxID=3424191 RepID=UPI003F200116
MLIRLEMPHVPSVMRAFSFLDVAKNCNASQRKIGYTGVYDFGQAKKSVYDELSQLLPTSTLDMLTDAHCRTAKPKDKLYRINDRRGLYLEIKPNGIKAWR